MNRTPLVVLPPMRASIVFAFVSIFVAFVALWLLDGCAMPLDRAQARGAVTSLAEAVRVADASCAKVALAQRDLELAKRCERSYRESRVVLVAAGLAVDAWDSVETREDTYCALRKTTAELSTIAADLEKLGTKLPPVISDARALVALLPPCKAGAS